MEVEGQSLTPSFHKNTTNYNVTVPNNVSSATVNGTAEDSKATVDGTGNKALSIGNNTAKIIVTAANGEKKTYTIVVTRKDDRSSNNKLSKLSVSSGTLNPGFSGGMTEYSLSVPYEISSLNVTATPEDSKSKVSVSGQNNLVAEETRDVKVTVTAENGNQRVYTIHVSRGKDPNKKLSDNNYLKELSTSIGILSPVFQKDKTNYAIYLPFEVDSLNLTVSVEDEVYATVTKEGPEKLTVGDNKYTYTVTAEDGSKRVYTVTVKRAVNLEDTNSNNTFLKSLSLKNGTLKEEFDKNKRIYFYTKKGQVSVTATPEIENSSISITTNDDIITIFVESSSGEINSYTLLPEEQASFLWIIIILILLLSGGGLLFLRYKKEKFSIEKKKTEKKKEKFSVEEKKQKLKKKVFRE